MSNIRIFMTEPPCQPEDVEKKYLADNGLEQKWYAEALAKIPGATGGLGWNPSLMPAAHAAKRAGITQSQFMQDVIISTPGVIPPGRMGEITRAYERSVLDVKPGKMIPVMTTERPAPIMLPVPVENETESFLRALFKPDETIVIAPGWYNPKRQREEPEDIKRQAKTRDEWIAAFTKTSPSDYFKNTTGIYVKINPLAPGVKQTKAGTLPLADDASITSFRWLLVESDQDSKEQQLGSIHACGLPYATIVDSGGKSLHALIRLDASSLEDFKSQTTKIYHDIGKLIVVDEANGNPARYSRLPGCKRGNGWQGLLECHENVPSVRENNKQKWLSGAFTLAEYYHMEMPQETTLLGNRYLCREGSMLFIGPSGIGKSSASVQCDILWALGQEAFGIKPAFPLKILCVQAENDDGDMIEMTRGVMHGLHLTDQEITSVGHNTLYRNYKDATGEKFLLWLEKLIDAYRPDIVRIDPLQAYLGEDAKEVSAVSMFCRTTLNPILTKYQCGCIIAHHTPKTTGRKTEEWHATDWMYAGAGSADLTNWARCVMVIDPVGDSQDVFKFIAAKRWKRLGWLDAGGYPIFARFFKHASGGSIFWEETDAPPEAEKERKFCKTDLLDILPDKDSLPKNVLISKAREKGAPVNKINGWIEELVFDLAISEFMTKRPGVRPEKHIAKGKTNPQIGLVLHDVDNPV